MSSRREQLRLELSALAADRAAAAERFLAELEFVEDLSTLHGDRADDWAELSDRAAGAVEQVVAAGRLDRLEQAVAEAEQILAPVGEVAKSYTIYCVGHAHIDMNWMWSWPETVHTTNDTFTTMLKLMEQFPDFCFTQSQASVYEIVDRYNPAMLKEIRRRVREGRWEVAASHWVEGDRNLVSGESLARHLLYTRRYLKELLGLDAADAPIDWSPDTFGHAWTVPAVDARGGVRWYYLCRGGVGWAKPPVFWFRAPDGSRVLVNCETTWYIDSLGPHNAKAMVRFCERTHLREFMKVYGVGDHGGGPTRRDIRRAHDMDGWPIFPRFRLSCARAFFELLEAQGDRWPVLDRELNFEFTGCYTTQALIKRNNRLGEICGVEAEWAGVLGRRAAGLDYPARRLERLWRDVCFNHFHDILPGSGVAATRRYSDGMFQRTAASASMIKTNALRAVAGRVETCCGLDPAPPPARPERESLAVGAGPGRNTTAGGITAAGHVAQGPWPFVVFNPVAWDRREVVVATVWDPQDGEDPEGPDRARYTLRSADGHELPAQKLSAGQWYWGHRYVELAFPASVGPLGYATFAARAAGSERRPPRGAVGYEKLLEAEPTGGVQTRDAKEGVEGADVGAFVMENEFLLVELDAATGGVSRLVDKAGGRDLARPERPMATLEFAHERHGAMTAWTIHPTREVSRPALGSLGWRHRGPWLAAVTGQVRLGRSRVTLTYTLKAGRPWLEIALQAQWLEVGGPAVGVPKLLMAFPMALDAARGRYEVPFGCIERPERDGQEVPALRWADVTGSVPGAGGARAGCALLNDCKYGHSLDGSTLRLTLIRSAYEPDPVCEVGEHAARMALVPHDGSISPAGLTRLGAAFNQPLQVVSTDLHAGDLPPRADAVNVEADEVILSSVKKAEDDEALIFRLVSSAAKAVRARVRLDPRLLGEADEAVEVDLLERPAARCTARLVKGGFSVEVPARGIASVRVALSG